MNMFPRMIVGNDHCIYNVSFYRRKLVLLLLVVQSTAALTSMSPRPFIGIQIMGITIKGWILFPYSLFICLSVRTC